MRYLLAVVLLVTALVPGAALAQDEAACTDEFVVALENHVAKIRVAQDEGELASVLGLLAALQPFVSEVMSLCGPWAWEGDSERLIGPVRIPEGYYRTTATVEDRYFGVTLNVLEGACDDGSFGSRDRSLLFNLIAEESPDGAEALVVSEGCSALLEVDAAAPWTLPLAKIG